MLKYFIICMYIYIVCENSEQTCFKEFLISIYDKHGFSLKIFVYLYCICIP